MAHRAALVTGGARGIGFSIAEAFARSGFNLTILSRTQESLAAAAPKLRALGADVATAALDVADHAAQAAAFEEHHKRFGRLDAAVINAGIFKTGNFIDGPIGDRGWEKTIQVDLTAALAGVQMAAQQMMAPAAGGGGGRGKGGGAEGGGGSGKGGVIIAMASAAGVLPLPGSPVYCAAKGGLVHVTRALAWPLAERGVTIAAVCPQFVDTGMVASLKDDPEAAKEVMAPWGVFGKPMLTTGQVVDVVMRVVDQHDREGQEARLARRRQLEAGIGCVHLLLQDGGGKVMDPFYHPLIS